MHDFKTYIDLSKEYDAILVEAIVQSLYEDCYDLGNFNEAQEYTALLSNLRKGGVAYATGHSKSAANIKTGKDLHQEYIKHAQEYREADAKTKARFGKDAVARLKATHDTEPLRQNAKTEMGGEHSDTPVHVPHDHHLHGKEHGGKTIKSYGLQGAPDEIDTCAGKVRTCAGSTSACRKSCLMKWGQNNIEAAKDSKRRATYSAIGLDRHGKAQSAEESEGTRRAYVHSLLHKVRTEVGHIKKNGEKTVLGIRGGYANDHMIDPLHHILHHGLADDDRKHVIETGYSGIRDPHNKHPGYVASLKGPAVKEKKDHTTGKTSVDYGDEQTEQHRHLHAMLSTVHDNGNGAKNAYGAVAHLRNSNPKINPDNTAQKKVMNSIHTVRVHHFDEHGNHVGHTDYDAKTPEKDHMEHDFRAIDQKNSGPHSKGKDGEHKGHVIINSLSSIAKGNSTKLDKPDEDGIRHTEYATNADFTFERKYSKDAKGRILHVHHPDTINKLPLEKRKQFGKNDSEFRKQFGVKTEHEVH